MYKHNILSGVTTVGKTPTVSGCRKKLSASGSMFLAGVFRSSGRISFALANWELSRRARLQTSLTTTLGLDFWFALQTSCSSLLPVVSSPKEWSLHCRCGRAES